jgi:serine/threonine-protein kinase
LTDAVQRLSGALADRYAVQRELGQGGMATVYLAHDVRHDRKVALKVLRPELAAVIGAERFLSEIKTTANLQHPHILPLFDSGAADSFLFYVMPFIEGESLRDRLNREKQLPINDAIRIATEVAGALDYAHRHNVIHRDIKPENILLHDGRALVADFGIALAASKAGSSRMTETGMSLGTPHYMSPEQAMGEREITARSDVYALGCVLYEMLTGDPPFTGSTAQAIVARVLTETPRPITAQRRTISPHVEAAVLTALEKLPADRFASAAQFAQALGDPSFAAPGARAAAPARRGARAMVPRRWLGVALAANLLLIAAALLWRRRAPDTGTSRQSVMLWHYQLPQPLEPGAPFVASQAAIAPDGSSIVYSDSTAGGVRLMRKLRDAADATPIAGAEGGLSPFFSPDGKWIGYVTLDGQLRKQPVSGGGAITLALDARGDYKAAAWLDDQTIVYVDRRGWFTRVSAEGGTGSAKVYTKPANADIATLSPLPGSRGLLFTYCNGNCAVQSDLYVYDFAADSARVLVPQAAGGWYSPTGHLLYTSRDGGLYAAAFDLRRLVTRSGAIPVIDEVDPTRFALSAAGVVVYSIDPAAQEPAELVWVTRDGRVTPVDSSWRGAFEYPALSPDGSALAVSLRGKTTDLWIRRANGTRQKVIADGAANWRASWMPDGKALTFISIRSADSADAVSVFQVQADGSGRAAEILHHRYGVWETEVSRDGRWMVIRSDEKNGDGNLYARRLGGDTALIPLLTDPSQTYQIALSPDGRWLAWCSNESGVENEIYVASFPDMGSKRLVSRGGGTEPRWSRNGGELFFKSGGQLMAVTVPPGSSFLPGDPHPLFSLAGFRAARNRPQYDVAPDGRFVMIRQSGRVSGVVYAEHWFGELLARVRR